MKSMALFSTLAALLMLQSCSSSNKELDKVPVPPPIDFTKTVKAKEAIETPIHEKPHQTTKQVKSAFEVTSRKSVLINGLKMQPTAFPLTKGTRIFVPNVNQYAVAAGDIIVISENSELPDEITAVFDVSPTVKNTFRLEPIQNNTDLLEHYQNLQKLDIVKRVELSIFYEGVNNKPLEIK